MNTRCFILIFLICIPYKIGADIIGFSGSYLATNKKDGEQYFFQGGMFGSHILENCTVSGQFMGGKHNSINRYDINGAISWPVFSKKDQVNDFVISIFLGVKGRVFKGSTPELGPSVGTTLFSYVGLSMSVAYARTYGDNTTDFVYPSIYITEPISRGVESVWMTVGYRGEYIIGRPLFHGAFLNIFFIE